MKLGVARTWSNWALAACLALPLLPALTGCASAPTSTDDVLTESDEPPARKRARIRLELAVGYFEQGQTTVALDELKQALITDPTLFQAYNLRGLVYMRLNDPRLAEESFQRALALSPGNGDVLHNLGWMQCQQGRYPESTRSFQQAIANPLYGARSKTWMTLGLCQIRAGQLSDAEFSLSKSYELDSGNPVTGYNLASLLYQRGQLERALFYVRRINNGELSNAESLWLGMKIENKLGNRVAREQLGNQLKKRYPQSRELGAYERGAFDE